MVQVIGGMVAATALELGTDSGQFTTLAVTPLNDTCLPSPSGLVSWWSGDGNANDLQGTNFGTLVNGASFGTGFVTSGNSQAFSLDGNDDRVRVEHSPSLNLAKYSIDAWIKADVQSTGEFHGIVVKMNPESTRDRTYYLGMDRDSVSHRILFSTETDSLKDLFSTNEVPVNVWTHVAATYDGRAMKIYLNGQLDASLDLGVTAVPKTGTDPLIIGYTNEGRSTYFKGLIDEVEIFDRALEPAEIAAIFNAGSAGKCKPN